MSAVRRLSAARRSERSPATATPLRPRRAPLRTPRDLVSLFSECRRLWKELFAAGGATIDTPEPPAGSGEGFDVAARTVVQPDGDILFVVTDRYWDDPDLRTLHSTRVAAWFERLEKTVTATTVALRRAAVTAVSLVVTASGLQAWRASLSSGVAVLVIGSVLGVVAQAAFRLVAGRALRVR